LNTDEATYYIVDSARILRAQEDSVLNHQLYTLEKDSSIYFSSDKLSAYILEEQNEDSGYKGIERPFTLEGDDGIFALLLICFVFFTRIYKGGFSFFKENSRLLLSARKNLSMFSETTTTEFWFNFILLFQTVLLASIIMFDSFLELEQYPVPQNSFYTVSLFTVTISIFLGIKYLLYRLAGYLFNMQSHIDIWLRNYMIVLEMMGIIAFIPTLMLVYSQNFHQYLLLFFLVLFILSRIILFYRLITFFLRAHVNFLFLIAYLCSLEIIPYFILYQILIYLYKIDIISWLWH